LSNPHVINNKKEGEVMKTITLTILILFCGFICAQDLDPITYPAPSDITSFQFIGYWAKQEVDTLQGMNYRVVIVDENGSFLPIQTGDMWPHLTQLQKDVTLSIRDSMLVKSKQAFLP